MQVDSSIPVITVDGPSGAGKGTLCRLVAQKTGFSLLDSGALYRLSALACIKRGVDIESEEQVSAVARGLNIAFVILGDSTKILLDEEDVSTAIREEAIGMTASKIAAYAGLRDALLERQRAFRIAPGLVADGRDMGTVIFPEAVLKIFLTASADERARRRVIQLDSFAADDPEASANYAKILADIRARDTQDSSRSASPLVPAEDAIILDSTDIPIDEVCRLVMVEVNKCL